MKNKAMNKILSTLLAAALMLGVVPTTAYAASVGAGSELVVDTSGKNTATGNQVYFGLLPTTNQPMLWRVVAKDANTVTLFYDDISVENRQYNSSQHYNWSDSDICAWLNGTDTYSSNGFLPTAFTDEEQGAIASNYSNTQEQGLSGIPYTPNQAIVLPSVAEVDDNGTWGMSAADRTNGVDADNADNVWRLRSPGNPDSNAAVVAPDGSVGRSGNVAVGGTSYSFNVSRALSIRPAFKLNLSSVIFTSAAAGGKSSVAVGDTSLSAAQPPTGAVKLTVEDNVNLSLTCTDTAARTVREGDTVNIDYSDAATSTNRYVSCVIVDSSGEITHYGKLSDQADNTVSFTVPTAAELPDGTYTLRVFNEQCYGDYYTDFASTPVDITLTVDNTAPNPPTPTPAPPSRDRSSDSDSGSTYTPPQTVIPSTWWIEKSEAEGMAKTAREKSLAYAISRRSGSTGIRQSALAALAGLKYWHDTLENGAVQVRVYIPKPEQVKKDLLMSGYVSGAESDKIKALFEKWFTNKLRVIHLEQQGDFGQPVSIAAKLDLSGMDTKNLVFYAYDKAANSYRRIEKPAYWIDSNGYLHFTSEYAGDIIISEGFLEKNKSLMSGMT